MLRRLLDYVLGKPEPEPKIEPKPMADYWLAKNGNPLRPWRAVMRDLR